jgi:hypothetical protein
MFRPRPAVENSRSTQEDCRPIKALARRLGMAVARAFVPQPAAFGAAREACGQQSEAQDGGEALAHGGDILPHRQPQTPPLPITATVPAPTSTAPATVGTRWPTACSGSGLTIRTAALMSASTACVIPVRERIAAAECAFPLGRNYRHLHSSQMRGPSRLAGSFCWASVGRAPLGHAPGSRAS